MSKLMIIPNNKQIIEKLINISDSFLFGLNDLSVNIPTTFTIDELKPIVELLNSNYKEVFIALNKNMHNGDLPLLEEVLLKLNELNIKGIFYYDIAIVNMSKRLNLNYELVWAQEHLTTNSFTCNYWKEFNVSSVLLSSEITIDEILEIRNNTDMKLIVPIFGHLSMFVSKRHLVNNYLNYFNLSDNSNVNYIVNDNKKYPIVDNDLGTIVYSSNILNGLAESLKLKNNKIDYFLMNSFNIDNETFVKIVDMYNKVNEENVDIYEREINRLLSNKTDKGFLYKETVYKVKNNEE